MVQSSRVAEVLQKSRQYQEAKVKAGQVFRAVAGFFVDKVRPEDEAKE
jgi:hypothetical protein